MSAIIHALRTIDMTIPSEILNAVFKECNEFNAVSLIELIRLQIINGRVLKDIDLINGETAYLPIDDGIIVDQSYTHTSVFFRDEYLQGREIISAMMYHATNTAQFNGGGYTNTGAGAPYQAGPNAASSTPCCPSQYGTRNGSALSSAINKLANVNAPMIPNTNTNLIVVAKNTILMRYGSAYPLNGNFEVQLSNDPYLNNISPKSIPAFTDLCVLALKSYIYKEMYIKLGQAALFNGQPLSQQNQYVEQLSSAEDDYQKYLRADWAKVSFINDTHKYHDFLKMHLNPFA